LDARSRKVGKGLLHLLSTGREFGASCVTLTRAQVRLIKISALSGTILFGIGIAGVVCGNSVQLKGMFGNVFSRNLGNMDSGAALCFPPQPKGRLPLRVPANAQLSNNLYL
jgi:hypothetical protein